MPYRHIQLFVNGLPVDYNITIEDPLFIFEPAFNPHDSLIAPKFTVKKEENNFYFENLEDESLRHQAEEEILEYFKAKNS